MWALISSILLGIFLIGYALKKYFERNQDYWTKRGVKNVKFPEGNLRTTYMVLTKQKNAVELDVDLYKEIGDEPFAGRVDLGLPSLLIKDPELIKQILVKDFDHFVDRRKVKAESDAILNHMLTTLEGQEWKNVRSAVSPTFTTGKIRRMFEHFNRCGADLVEYLKSKPVGAPRTRDIVMKEFVSRYLVDVIAATAFGMNTSTLKDQNSIFYTMSKRMGDFSALKMIKGMLLIIMPFLTKLGFRLMDAQSMDFFEDILRKALKNREESKEKRDDFLQLMIEARKGELKIDESELEAFEKDAQLKIKQKSLSDMEVIAQSILFFIAGLETTGSVLSMVYYILALHPDIQEKVYEEVSKSMKANGGQVDYDAVSKMEYVDKVIAETMRMYAVGTRLERRCTQEYKLPGTDVIIEKDVLVAIPVYAMHRDPKLYPNPERFDPERFSQEEKAKRNPYTYMPFGQGPRNCIGMRFALMEAKVGIAYIVYNFFIEPSEKTPVPLKVDPTFGIRPDPTVELRFKERIH